MKNKNKYPEYIMNYVRQGMGLEENDTSKDDFINNVMSKNDVFDSVCDWQGLISWGVIIKDWVSDIYNIDLE